MNKSEDKSLKLKTEQLLRGMSDKRRVVYLARPFATVLLL